MNENVAELTTQLHQLMDAGTALRNAKLERERMRSYRTLYVASVQNLSDHIRKAKDGRLSEEAKELLGFDSVFKKFRWLSGMLAAGIGLSFVLIVYLYMMDELNMMYMVSAIAVVASFLLIRYTQRYSVTVAQEIEIVTKVSRRLLKMLKEAKN